MRLQGFVPASSARLGDALRQLREVEASGDGHRLRVDHAGQALRCYRGLGSRGGGLAVAGWRWRAGGRARMAARLRRGRAAANPVGFHMPGSPHSRGN
ncbi:hypothetical protein EN817_33190, partial [Mesorhizobium sp. M3A.F.Ca.ET.174.01.1.1]